MRQVSSFRVELEHDPVEPDTFRWYLGNDYY